jgi:hypothetical protein
MWKPRIGEEKEETRMFGLESSSKINDESQRVSEGQKERDVITISKSETPLLLEHSFPEF